MIGEIADRFGRLFCQILGSSLKSWIATHWLTTASGGPNLDDGIGKPDGGYRLCHVNPTIVLMLGWKPRV